MFVIDSITLFYLTQLKSDTGYKIRLIADAKSDLHKEITNLIDTGTDLSSDSPLIKNMKARRDKLELVEKELDVKMEKYRTKMATIDTEIGEVKEAIKKSAQEEFKYSL